MDNRLGCFVALEAARLVAEAGGAPGDVAAVGGHAGGDHVRRRAHDRVLAAARHRDRRRRDVRDRRAGHRGEGARAPQVRLRPGAHARLDARTRACSSCCTRPARPRASRSRSPPRARATGTDADAFHISRAGIPSAVVSVPLRYMHSPVEMVQLDDVENAAQADRRLRAPARARPGPAPLKPLLLLFDIDGTLLQRRRGRARAGAARGGRAGARAAGRWTATGRGRRAHRRGDHARPRRGRPASTPADVDARWPEVREAAVAAYDAAVPARPVGPRGARRARAARARWPRGRTSSGSRCVTGNLEPIARLQARARRDRRTTSSRARAASAPTTTTRAELPAIARAAPATGRASARS